MIRVNNLSLPAREDGHTALLAAAARVLCVQEREISRLSIRRRSIDARKKHDVRIIYTVDVSLRGGDKPFRDPRVTRAERFRYEIPRPAALPDHWPVIVGFGPAGMFAGLILAEAGLRPIILERGLDVDSRTRLVQKFWQTGKLDTGCNVQFGEGGAGTFSDGKLNTGTKNPRISWVLEKFAEFGADESVTYDAKPHVGTDKLRTVVKNLRERILSLGGEVRFASAMTGMTLEDGAVTGVEVNGDHTLPCRALILAIGHSARDTFSYLHALGVPMEPKPFAMGVRIEHNQSDIDRAQYGDFAGLEALGTADYKLAVHTKSGSAYTFCMCPGGYVVAAASEEGRVVTNGMSYSGRAGENANAALLVGLTPEDFPYPGVLGGMEWQRELEGRAFEIAGGGYKAPAQTVGSFLGTPHEPSLTPTYAPGVTWCDLHDVLPERITQVLEEALPEMDKKLHGFASPGAVLTGPETRSSSPVRILRGEDRQSPAIRGLYPCGEGAGYAGGITSAAVDGILCAEAVIRAISQS